MGLQGDAHNQSEPMRREATCYISPRNLPLLFMTIKSFVESSKNSIVLIDSIGATGERE